MIGILVQLLLSGLLLWWIEKQSLSVLGWQPSQKRLFQFVAGFFLTMILATTYHLIHAILTGTDWQKNPAFQFSDLFNGLWWMLRSVVYEELIFRGALFYIALRKLGVTKALWLSVIAFGIYHWFSFGAWGQPIQMIFIFLITAAAGWMYSHAFIKTGSLYSVIGLHFGWNSVGSLVFSQGSIGKYILIPVKDPLFQQNEWASFLFMFLYQFLVPAFITWLWLRKYDGEKYFKKEKS
ncbi:MAG: CPBP family intramembrane metalloprotease [Chitinophagaceae bacterium]|nr:CPBP family intramembrane metalloprotease [Chitinophagaceae bacterium]